ncbi:MAG: glycosyltransferase [Ruminococcus sp.]|nr:glycosyltransferase [Ruminococcus sp.]
MEIMKASIKQYRDNDIILSIGMIVKNEEKVLRRCLDSLKPLMKAIKSELIIADTGSTDSTVEIAKEYTDNVFHFEWINDFSAARNSTLKKAKGQWYMFIDADEYLDEDIGEMIHFFSIPELRSKYKSLQINVRSYGDEGKTNYQDGLLTRFQRISEPDDNIEFIGSVHETMYTRFPLGYFSVILHHTGYCFSSVKQNFDKKNRNMVLMREEYKKNPTDLRMLSHLIDGGFFNPDETEKYIQESLELVRKDRFHMYSNVLYMQAIMFYENSKPEYALELCKEYHQTLPDSDRYVATLSVVLSEAKILSAFSRYEEAYEALKRYIRLYKDYIDEKMNTDDSSAHPILGMAPHEYMRFVYMSVLCLVKLKRFDEAFTALDGIDITELENEEFREFLGTLREVCTEKKDYSYLAKYYIIISNTKFEKNDKDKKALCLYMLESVYYSLITDVERKKYAMDIINNSEGGIYPELMRLVIFQEDVNFTDNFKKVINKIENWDDGYTVAIYLAIKHKIDISDIVLKMNTDLFRVQLETVASNNDDFTGYVLEYGMPQTYTSTIKQFYWIVSLYEKAAYYSYKLNNSDKYKIYNIFTSLLGDYVMNIYNPELLNDDDIQVLPNLHKFGFYMSQAQASLNAGDSIGYIRGMKKALVNCESMREIVEFMLEEFKKMI